MLKSKIKNIAFKIAKKSNAKLSRFPAVRRTVLTCLERTFILDKIRAMRYIPTDNLDNTLAKNLSKKTEDIYSKIRSKKL